MLTRRYLFLIPACALLVSAYILLFTRFGVFVVFDLIGDVQGDDKTSFTHDDAPVHISQILQAHRRIDLPKQIEQVSGIYVAGDKIALSTDQTELFILDRIFPSAIQRSNLIPWTPLLLRQGTLEALTEVNGNFVLAGETSSILSARLTGERAVDWSLPSRLNGTEITGLAHRDGSLFATTSGSQDVVYWNIETSEMQTLVLDFSAFVKEGDVAKMVWSGVSVVGTELYLVSEDYPIIAVANAETGLVTKVLGLPGEGGFSDIAIYQGQVFLPRDHNLFDPKPPLEVFLL